MAQARHNTAHSDPVSESYARAMFELALEHNALDATGDEIHQVADLVEENRDLASLFAHLTIDAGRRAATIEKIFGGRLSRRTLNFLLLLNRKGRLSNLRAIVAAFDRMAKEKRGEIDVEVYTARPLGPGQMDAVVARISAAIGKKAIVHPHVDGSLIGGLKVRIGDRLMDASVAAQLRRMARRLEENGHERVRSNAARLLVETA
jgi:F-type H+-transporting ATPase subunit delta